MPKNASKIKTVTRKLLRDFGLSNYHAVAITKMLQPIKRQGSSYIYSVNDVITSIRQYMEHPRIKSETRTRLKNVLNVLLNLLENVISVAFGTSTDPELSRLTRELIASISETDSSLAALKLDAVEIKAKYSTKGNKS